ncbi:uncharacterized protein LOC131020170 [Salvia miltiorrhiza]|uniref:uncharacterized protein LOC131020170 n=1 Tax=Salvia miltiorrhiza TaxID=226208 RepID=UPI0025AD70FA|nr:uncharacterized protein LOC131020170 [Salvia miltiorrhiza]XP_057804841.1 uncharacterized protein LOC131020170 [Salvia miltiorrhiza]XP_057804842.1 uncharacterized protein LOC131020170 [Salvia miltiorrhiza]XP_057804843.1 uncharacterized protein LOC131020170 [Salvia miltiorrhiza]
MECNKDEAVRAKGIAENKLLERDIAGAKMFGLKAQSLFPELDGLSQFLEIIDVYVAHEKKINGVSDYYGIFGLDPFCDEEILRKQYKRMALFLHPDKNKSVGAEGAFQIMSEAWSVLSDKDKRSEYDLKVNLRSSNQTASFNTSNVKYTTPATDPQRAATRSNFQQSPVTSMQFQTIYDPLLPRNTAPPSGNHSQIHKFRKNPLPAFAAQYIPTPSPPFHNSNVPSRNQMTSSSCSFRPDTFWTLCNRCNVQYEYKNIYLNQTLLCRRCQRPFLAKAISDPPVHNRSSHPRPFPNQQQQEMPTAAPPSASRSSHAPLSHASKKYAKRRHEVPINMGRENDPPMNYSCSVPENVETASASYTASPGVNKERPVKRRRLDGQKCDGSKEGSQGTAGSGVYMKKASADVKGKFGAEQSRSVELSQRNIRAMLIGKAKAEIRRQLNEWEKQKLTASLLNGQDTSNIVHALSNNSINNPQTKNQLKLGPSESSTFKETVADANSDDFVSMSVPDANFHNFDEDRIENSFSNNQVWAAYDDDDGMPRYYAMVHHVISRSPFKMQISWLNSKSCSEFGSLDWVASGFTKTTGNFRAGKYVVSERLNSFSHPVKWVKGLRGVIHILPTKGDVWALYRNWAADWDENTADETIHKYNLVVVLRDYNEDTGVLVAPLIKVAGFTSVFNQLPDQRGIQIIPREEMFRFSHQVPFHLLNGLEAENAPKNCYELDPAALPLELLKTITITDAQSAERIVADLGMLRATGLGNEMVTESCPTKAHTNQRSGVEDPKYIFTYSRRNKGKKIGGDVGQP